MLKRLLCLVALCSLILPAFLTSAHAATSGKRCGEEPLKTLLSLYRDSDSIHRAVFDGVTDVSVEEETENYTAVNTKRRFTISTTLKGTSRKFVDIAEVDYRYKSADETTAETPSVAVENTAEPVSESSAPEALVEEEQEADPAILAEGDTILLFLNEGKESKEPVLAHYRDAVKKVSDAALPSYEARIKELNGIFRGKQVNDTAIVEWLVRASEDRFTRWEGTAELLRGFQELDWQKELEERKAAEESEGTVTEADHESEETEETDESGEVESTSRYDVSKLAQALTDAQKERLADVLLNKDESTVVDRSLVYSPDGSDELINLVKRWNDPRFLGFMLARLRNATETYEIADAMELIAKSLEDEKATEISNTFRESSYQMEDDKVEDDSKDSDQESTVDSKATAENGDPNSERESEPRMTYKELRGKLIQQFNERVDLVIALRELAKTEHAAAANAEVIKN